MRLRTTAAVALLAAGSLLRPSPAAAKPAPAPAPAPISPVGVAMLAGLLPCTDEARACWPWSGAWVFPVGDSLEFGRACADEPAYRVNRGVLSREKDGEEHDGADLANGVAGGCVRAAASGLVVAVETTSRGGYGSTLVIAHHLDEGGIVYSVYAHLLEGSIRIRAGSAVSAGEAIARVGQTGRATTPHLHFEVRTAPDSTLRWERCPIEDPMEFVRARLPGVRSNSDWAAPFIAWAEFAALVPRGLSATTPLDAAMLSQVLERAGVRDGGAITGHDVSASAGDGGTDALGWNSVARALTELGTHPRRLPPCGVEPKRYGQVCIERLGVRRPSRELHRLAARDDPPTVGELCLALADFAARAPKLPPARHSRHRRR